MTLSTHKPPRGSAESIVRHLNKTPSNISEEMLSRGRAQGLEPGHFRLDRRLTTAQPREAALRTTRVKSQTQQSRSAPSGSRPKTIPYWSPNSAGPRRPPSLRPRSPGRCPKAPIGEIRRRLPGLRLGDGRSPEAPALNRPTRSPSLGFEGASTPQARESNQSPSLEPKFKREQLTAAKEAERVRL